MLVNSRLLGKHFDIPAICPNVVCGLIGISWTPSQCIAVSNVSTHTYRHTLRRRHLQAEAAAASFSEALSDRAGT
jgi:hypothetical protein